MDGRSTATTMIGQPVAMPVAIAPTGLYQWHAACRRRDPGCTRGRKFGVPFTLSTMSICSIEDVAAATTKPFWFQLYVMRDRAFVDAADRPREGGRLQRAGADAGPADPASATRT